MSDIIDIKQFYNHDTRIALLENIASDLRDDMKELRSDIKEIKKDINEVRKDINEVRKESHSDFKWLLGFIISGFIGVLVLIAHTQHWII
jgi:archaellum component FlaC